MMFCLMLLGAFGKISLEMINMSDRNRDTLCPLKFMADNGDMLCEESECEWFSGSINRCSVASIPVRLKSINLI